MNGQQAMGFGEDPLEATYGQLAGPVFLSSLTARERQRTLEHLRDWVANLVSRFSIEPRVIPPCWERHNGMVEALLALKDHERASYAETASPTSAVEWFRAFREVEARLVELSAQTQCSVHEHRANPQRAWALERPATAAPEDG
jgi:hypothetical protein